MEKNNLRGVRLYFISAGVAAWVIFVAVWWLQISLPLHASIQSESSTQIVKLPYSKNASLNERAVFSISFTPHAWNSNSFRFMVNGCLESITLNGTIQPELTELKSVEGRYKMLPKEDACDSQWFPVQLINIMTDRENSLKVAMHAGKESNIGLFILPYLGRDCAWAYILAAFGTLALMIAILYPSLPGLWKKHDKCRTSA